MFKKIASIFSSEKFNQLKTYAKAHKFLSGFTVLVVILLAYWGVTKLTSTAGELRYVTASVQKGTVIVSITGTGQVSASNQIDLKPKASGDVISVGVKNGQKVGAGQLIVQLDTQEAQKAVRDAQVNLDSAKLSLQKLQEPADVLSMTQAQNSLDQAQNDLQKSYTDGYNNISNTFIDLPAVISGLQDILYGNQVGGNGQFNISAYNDMVQIYDTGVNVFKDNTAAKFQTARTSYDQNLIDYKNVTRFSNSQDIENLINETYETTKNLAEAIKASNDMLSFIKDQLTKHQTTAPAILTTHQSSLTTYTSQINNDLLNLSSVKNTIFSSKQSITEKTQSLAKLKQGADTLDLASQQLTVQQRENALADAKATLNNYYVTAPFDGTIAAINVKKYDSASSGTAVATLITDQKLAEISLNEVDAAKVKVGQKATLTFDAVDGLTIAGSVAEVDAVGTVSQGVVTYTIKIGFDTQDDRVKPGMSVNASIITDTKQDVLVVANTAIKSQGNTSYVEVFNPPLAGSEVSTGIASTRLPNQVVIETGLSNDTSTEIISGLNAGDQVVTRTITPSTAVAGQAAPSLLGGNTRAGGAATGGTFRAATGR